MRIGTKWRSALAALALLALGPTGSHGQAVIGASPWAATDQTQVRLVAAQTGTADRDTVRLGLHFKLEPGWKVYWRSPGAAGFPPAIDWSGSQNLAAATMRWPAPQRFSVLGLDTLGYEDEIVIPIDVALSEPGNALFAHAALTYLTCNEICIPYEAALSLEVPGGPAYATPQAHLVDRFAAAVPGDGSAAGLAIEDARVVAADGGQVLEVRVRATPPFDAPDLFVEGRHPFEFGAPEIALNEGGGEARIAVPVATIGSGRPDLAGEPLTLTLVDGERAMERSIPSVPGAAVSATARSLLSILAVALLGGLILNLMPCVLPVLSLKLLSVVGHGGAERRAVRAGFLATAAGIVVSFLVIAAGLLALKAAGLAVGWGIQFQQPAFLIAMTLIVAVFAGNLFGLFEFGLPGGLAGRIGGPGRDATMRGHFLAGAFATLLATPCSAPFVGTAIGFALSRGAVEIALVFLALGVGLALPYLAVALLPGLATRLPRPGAWMTRLRFVLGLALAATAIWLVTVLAAQTGATDALAVAGVTVLVVMALWLRRRLIGAAGVVAAGFAAIFAVLAFAVPAGLPGGPAPDREAARGQSWQPFAPDRIAERVRAGKVVFVDVTADWCITCQVNKTLVLDREPVAARLAAADVVPMLADWTRPDAEIAAYLAEFGRYGIPFNAVYGPGAPAGLPLPELLTRDGVMAAIERARAGGAPGPGG